MYRESHLRSTNIEYGDYTVQELITEDEWSRSCAAVLYSTHADTGCFVAEDHVDWVNVEWLTAYSDTELRGSSIASYCPNPVGLHSFWAEERIDRSGGVGWEMVESGA